MANYQTKKVRIINFLITIEKSKIKSFLVFQIIETMVNLLESVSKVTTDYIVNAYED